MAQTSVTKSIQICSFLLLATFLIMRSEAHAHHQVEETRMSFFLQDIATGPNTTNLIVAGNPGVQPWKFNEFGSLSVADDALTEGIEQSSKEIGRAQFISLASSFDGTEALVLGAILFTNKEYNGSTLQIQSALNQFAVFTELAIVSGTGKFRFARGYATFDRLSYDPSTTHSVFRVNITVLH